MSTSGLSETDKLNILADAVSHLSADGIYIGSLQDKVRYFHHTPDQHHSWVQPISASPFGTSGTRSAIETLVYDISTAITDFYILSATDLEQFGFNVQFPLSANGKTIFLVSGGESGQPLTPISSPTFAGLTLTDFNGVIRASNGVLIGDSTTSNLPEGSNLYWTSTRSRYSVSGTANQIIYSPSTGIIGIASTYEGQTSITTLGTIIDGTWNGAVIDTAYGGTGLSTVGSAGQVLTSNGSSLIWLSVSGAIGTGYLSAGTTTSEIPEGSNLYFTTTRARESLTGIGNIDYDQSTGIINLKGDIDLGNLTVSGTSNFNTIEATSVTIDNQLSVAGGHSLFVDTTSFSTSVDATFNSTTEFNDAIYLNAPTTFTDTISGNADIYGKNLHADGTIYADNGLYILGTGQFLNDIGVAGNSFLSDVFVNTIGVSVSAVIRDLYLTNITKFISLSGNGLGFASLSNSGQVGFIPLEFITSAGNDACVILVPENSDRNVIDGGTDIIMLRVRGSGSQTEPIFQIERYDHTPLFRSFGDGSTYQLGDQVVSGTSNLSDLYVNGTSILLGDVGIGTSSLTTSAVTIAGKYLLFSDSSTKLGDEGIIAGNDANGNTQLEYFYAGHLAITEGNTEVARFESGKFSLVSLASHGSGLVTVNNSGVLSFATSAMFLSAGSTTSNIPEGSNLYWTLPRTRFSVSGSNNIDYNTSSGIINLKGDITVSNLTVSADLNVNGISNLNTISTDGITVDSQLSVAGGHSLFVDDVSFSTSVDATFNSTVEFNDTTYLNADVFFVAPISGNSNITTNTLNVSGTSKFNTVILNGLTGVLKSSSGTIVGSSTTTDLPEGSNLYFTTSRARNSLSGIGNIDYDSSTGIINLKGDVVLSNLTVSATINSDTISTNGITIDNQLSVAGGHSLFVDTTSVSISVDTTFNSTTEFNDAISLNAPTTFTSPISGNVDIYGFNLRAAGTVYADDGLYIVGDGQFLNDISVSENSYLNNVLLNSFFASVSGVVRDLYVSRNTTFVSLSGNGTGLGLIDNNGLLHFTPINVVTSAALDESVILDPGDSARNVIDGGSDIIMLRIRGSGSQTEAIFQVERYDHEPLFQSFGDGSTYQLGDQIVSGTSNLVDLNVNGTTNLIDLNVNGSIDGTVLNLQASSPYIQLTPNSYGGSYQSYFGSWAGAIGVLQLGNNGDNYIVGGNTGAGGKLNFVVNNTNQFPSTPNGIIAMTLAATGFVGIGAIPQTIFQVRAGLDENLWVRSLNTVLGSGTGIVLEVDNDTGSVLEDFGIRANTINLIAGNNASDIYITSGGLVGVGHKTPQAKLDVNGSFITRSSTIMGSLSGNGLGFTSLNNNGLLGFLPLEFITSADNDTCVILTPLDSDRNVIDGGTDIIMLSVRGSGSQTEAIFQTERYDHAPLFQSFGDGSTYQLGDQVVSGTSNLVDLNVNGTSNLLGTVGIGDVAQTNVGLAVYSTNLTLTSQAGIDVEPVFSTAATNNMYGVLVYPRSVSGSYTTTNAYGIDIEDYIKGAGHAITTQYGLRIANQTKGATNYSIYTGTGTVYFGDKVGIGTTAPSNQLTVYGSTPYIAMQSSGSGQGTAHGFQLQADHPHAYVWNYEAGKLFLGTNSTLGITIDTAANVGIGTSSPSDALQIGDSSTSGKYIRIQNGSGESKASYITYVGTTSLSANQTWYGGINVIATDGSYEIKNTGGQGISINPSGTVSVGTLIGGVSTWAGLLTINADFEGYEQNAVIGTRSTYAKFGNGGGNLYYGVENDAGGQIFPGSLPYAAVFGTGTATSFQLATHNAIRLTIDDAGNVGIDTASPLALLSVGAGSISDSNAIVQISNTGSGSARYYGANSDGSYGLLVGYVDDVGGQTGGQIRVVPDTNLYFVVSNDLTAMTITPDGNVGIGTSTPSVALEVAGQIMSTSSGVTPTTAAFVAVSEVPAYQLKVTTETTNGQIWSMAGAGNILYFQAYEHTGTDANSWLEVTRDSGDYTISKINFPNGNIGIHTNDPHGPLEIHLGIDQNILFRSFSGESIIESVDDAFGTDQPLRYYASQHSFLGGNVNIGNLTGLGSGIVTVNNNGTLGFLTSAVFVSSPGTYTKFVADSRGRITSAGDIDSDDVITALGFTPGDIDFAVILNPDASDRNTIIASSDINLLRLNAVHGPADGQTLALFQLMNYNDVTVAEMYAVGSIKISETYSGLNMIQKPIAAGGSSQFNGINISTTLDDTDFKLETIIGLNIDSVEFVAVDGNKLNNIYGIKISDVISATDINSAIWTDAGLISFGDRVEIRNTIDLSLNPALSILSNHFTFDASLYKGISITESISNGSSDTTSSYVSLYIQPAIDTIEGGNVNQDIIGILIDSSVVTGGTPTNEYGLKISDIQNGAYNWAIKTGLGKVEFGGGVYGSSSNWSNVDISDDLIVYGKAIVGNNFSVGAGKFVVSASTGNTVVGGALNVSGTSNLVDLNINGTTTGTASVWSETLAVGSVDGQTALIRGLTKAVRVTFNPSESLIEGVDYTGSATYQPLVINGSMVTIRNSGSDVLKAAGGDIDVYGNVHIDSAKLIRVDTVNDAANDANIIYRSTSSTVVGNGPTLLVVQDAGNVGIGTSSPQALLDVNGTFIVRSDTIMGSLSGNTDGYIAIDNNGLLSYSAGAPTDITGAVILAPTTSDRNDITNRTYDITLLSLVGTDNFHDQISPLFTIYGTDGPDEAGIPSIVMYKNGSIVLSAYHANDDPENHPLIHVANINRTIDASKSGIGIYVNEYIQPMNDGTNEYAAISIATTIKDNAYKLGNAYGLMVNSFIYTGGNGVENAYGLYIDSIDSVDGNSYAIRTNSGIVSIGDLIDYRLDPETGSGILINVTNSGPWSGTISAEWIPWIQNGVSGHLLFVPNS